MPSNTVAKFAVELKMPADALLEQLRSAGIEIKSVDDVVTDVDKAKLLESFRRSRSGSEGKKITLTRRQTSEIRQADSSGRSRTIPVEVRKKRVFVKRDPAELVSEAAKALSEEKAAAESAPVEAESVDSRKHDASQTPTDATSPSSSKSDAVKVPQPEAETSATAPEPTASSTTKQAETSKPAAPSEPEAKAPDADKPAPDQAPKAKDAPVTDNKPETK